MMKTEENEVLEDASREWATWLDPKQNYIQLMVVVLL